MFVRRSNLGILASRSERTMKKAKSLVLFTVGLLIMAFPLVYVEVMYPVVLMQILREIMWPNGVVILSIFVGALFVIASFLVGENNR